MTVAMVLYNGEGNVKTDKVKAEEWLEKAIMMNTHSRCNEANFDLANILFSHGDENNLKRGWQLLNFAGKHYYKPAIKMIADIYYCGKYNIIWSFIKLANLTMSISFLTPPFHAHANDTLHLSSILYSSQ